ncbi:uncharacterized protein LOC125177544 [Hyalella azteca]|uniref:Uncharacterized protein LOC125177544 n=1 Tax=Hyalella azteca TaxID=294128 RepID=A0A979FWI6_HYAAZ|nr:uncharacterized protein LOC125177544 [Hyalella azteca]
MFSIPRSTLRFRLKSTDPVGSRKSGAPPALSPEEEKLVVDWVLETARMGQPPSWKRLSLAVKEMLDRSGHTKVFTNNNIPSSGWLRAFKKRHPNLSPAKTDDVPVPDTFTKEDIKKWFVDLQTHLKEEGLDPKTFLQPANGNRIFNSVEVVVMLQGEDRLSKVLTQKGKRNVPKFCSTGRKMITVMTCISASGTYLRPFIVFEGRKIPLQQLQNQVDPTLFDVGFSKRGGIDHELFSVWVEGLISYLDNHNVQRPVLLLLDSHTCHINLNTCEMAKEAGLIMHLLPPHANHLMQPVDVGIFKTLKASYKDSVDHFMPTHGPAINKKHFPLVFINAWHSAAIKENAISGFKEAGLVPLNPEMIDTTKIPTRPRFSLKTFHERAPGRPLHTGTRPSKRTPQPTGNEYIRGISDALEHIIHNFVSDKVRPIYEQWIVEEKSCTPDPVFYIWASLKTLIEENKKQLRCEKGTSSQIPSRKITSFQPPPVRPLMMPSIHSQANHNQAPSMAARGCSESMQPSPLPQHSKRPVPCSYGDHAPNHGQAPASYAGDHTTSWQTPVQVNTFSRYLSDQPPQHGPHPTTQRLQPLMENSILATTTTTMMQQQPPPPVNYYGLNSKEKPKEATAIVNKNNIKRQWLDDKETQHLKQRRIDDVTLCDTKDSQTNPEGCGVYDSSESINYSARIGICMQDVVPQDLCQLHYGQE